MNPSNKFESYEEPLRGGLPYYYKAEWKKSRSFQGPKRAIRLCILCIVLPGLLVGVPLYLKHHVFAYQMYPVGISDMRLIDGKVSTTWCQRQVVRANTTFNAFLLPEIPETSSNRIHVDMTRHLELSDDMKEYWGFYLLKGSSVTVSTCARWPGASLILIRGHKHLQECAYIGDDSSEELEELLEIAAEKGIDNLQISSPESPANRVELLTKHRPEVQFHDSYHRENRESFTFSPHQELAKDSEDNISGKRMKALLNLLPHKANVHKANKFKTNITGGSHVDRLKAQLKIEIENREKLNKTGSTGKRLPPTMNIEDFARLQQADHIHKARVTNIGNHETENVEISGKLKPDNIDNKRTDGLDGGTNTLETSSEILEDVLKQLDKLSPDKRKKVLDRLTVANLISSDLMTPTNQTNTSTTVVHDKISTGNATDEVEILDLHKPNKKLEIIPVNISKKQTTTINLTQKINATAAESKKSPETSKRDTLLRLKRQLALENELSSVADESENLGIEQGYVPDGIADHHHILNHTTLNDRSNSEFWSSFSSSEEALLNCAGLILSLPLNPNGLCQSAANDNDFGKASTSNTITYTVPSNGYYFFVFNSENEVQDNYIRVKFDIKKNGLQRIQFNSIMQQCDK